MLFFILKHIRFGYDTVQGFTFMDTSQSIIDAKNITHCFEESDEERLTLDDITFSVRRGEFIAILGHNGSGKSTLARHLNALIRLQSGELTVAGFDVTQKDDLWSVRKACGMVFQNPENQFVSSVVEEDIAFGPDNYDFDPDKTDEIIKRSLATVGMSGYEKKSPHLLSGGQKQRIAIAGVLAVDPEILIMDEATSMLDPAGRKSILSLALRLNKEHGKTVIMITHYIDEALDCDRVIIMKNGRILKDGDMRDILTDTETLEEARIIPPFAVRLANDLRRAGVVIDDKTLTMEELSDQLCR